MSQISYVHGHTKNWRVNCSVNSLSKQESLSWWFFHSLVTLNIYQRHQTRCEYIKPDKSYHHAEFKISCLTSIQVLYKVHDCVHICNNRTHFKLDRIKICQQNALFRFTFPMPLLPWNLIKVGFFFNWPRLLKRVWKFNQCKQRLKDLI